MESKVIKESPAMPIKYYKHSRKPKTEIKDVDFNKIVKSLDLTLFQELYLNKSEDVSNDLF